MQMSTMSATTELANAIGQGKSVRGLRMIKEKNNYICSYDKIPGKLQIIIRKLTQTRKELIEVIGYKINT